MRRLLLLSLLVPGLLVSCTSGPPPAPPAPPKPAPAPPPPPPPPPPAADLGPDWRDWPLTPGTWDYRQDARGSIALFGVPGADADFAIRCDRLRRQIYISRHGAPEVPGGLTMTVYTSSAARIMSAAATGGTPPYIAVPLNVRDPVLDAMGFSRGRFLVTATGMRTLVLPAWAEVLRVTEDCR